jgi:hypothetical protein
MAPRVPAPCVFVPGDRVRLRGAFLRSTGQVAGGEAFSRWTVQAVQTFRGGAVLVLTDELRANPGEYFTPAELAADPTLYYRRILASNLEKCR